MKKLKVLAALAITALASAGCGSDSHVQFGLIGNNVGYIDKSYSTNSAGVGTWHTNCVMLKVPLNISNLVTGAVADSAIGL